MKWFLVYKTEEGSSGRNSTGNGALNPSYPRAALSSLKRGSAKKLIERLVLCLGLRTAPFTCRIELDVAKNEHYFFGKNVRSSPAAHEETEKIPRRSSPANSWSDVWGAGSEDRSDGAGAGVDLE